MDVTLLSFEGCPSREVFAANLRAALRRVGRLYVEVHSQRIVAVAEGAPVGFAASPTVLIDGRDPFADPAAQAGLSCRVYRTPTGLAGSPTVDQLVEVLNCAATG